MWHGLACTKKKKNISWALIQTKLVNKCLSAIIATASHVKLDSFLEFQQILRLKFQKIKCIDRETFLMLNNT